MFHAPTTENKQQNDVGRSALKAEHVRELSPPTPVTMRQKVMLLHGIYGNQAVLRMLSHPTPAIQTKRTVNQPGDPYEQEADRVADQVMRMTEPPGIQRKCSACAEEEKLQRKCAECEEEERKTELHRKEIGAGPQFAPPSVQQVLNSPGQPLDPATRAFMEPRFGYDFSHIRVHTGSDADSSAREVNALAYTVGQDIVFATGRYTNQSKAGQALLAHELAHTLQQGRPNPRNHLSRKCKPEQIGPKPPSCNITNDPAVGQRFFFKTDCNDFEAGQKEDLQEFAKKIPAGSTANVLGLASSDGDPAFNESLSCNRGFAAAAVLSGNGVTVGTVRGTGGIGAKGDTTLHAADIQVQNAPGPVPPKPGPEPPARVCGPDVGPETRRAWASAISAFNSMGFADKINNCRMLVQPITGLHLNQDAFDTWGLFQGSAGWTRVPPWHGNCGSPGSVGNLHDNFDPLHESDSVCSNTVKIGSDCWLSGTPNYGLFGIAMRACSDFTDNIPGLSGLFSLAATAALVGAYKLLKGDNIIGPEKWAIAAWLGGPGATASGGNRQTCATSCPGPPPPLFLIVWEPNMPRSGMPAGPPYIN